MRSAFLVWSAYGAACHASSVCGDDADSTSMLQVHKTQARATDDVSVDHLVLAFVDPPPAPADCPDCWPTATTTTTLHPGVDTALHPGVDTATTTTTTSTEALWERDPPLQNEHENCWTPCDRTAGPCEFCGAEGVCCREGFSGDPEECGGLGGGLGRAHHSCRLPVVQNDNEFCSGVYEAEDATIHGGVEHANTASANHQGFTGRSFVDYLHPTGDFVEWTVDSCGGGPATASFRYALGGGNRPLQVLVNDEEVESSLSFPATGSWRTWSEASTHVHLRAGVNHVKLVATGRSGANMDSLTITPDFFYGQTADGCPRDNSNRASQDSDNIHQATSDFSGDLIATEAHSHSGTTASVRCCSMDGSSCSTNDLDGGCQAGKTLAEAHAICAANDKRLCTEHEMADNVCCNTGCWFNHHAVWVTA